MSHKVRRLTAGAYGPGNLAGRHGQRVDQHAGLATYVLVFTPLATPRLGWFGGRFALQHLHASFFIAADHQAALAISFQGLDVELTNGVGFGSKVFIMTVEPVLALVGLEIYFVQDTPDAGATDGLLPMLRERCDQVVQTPPGSGTMIRGWFPGRHRQHLDALRGGETRGGRPERGASCRPLKPCAR